MTSLFWYECAFLIDYLCVCVCMCYCICARVCVCKKPALAFEFLNSVFLLQGHTHTHTQKLTCLGASLLSSGVLCVICLPDVVNRSSRCGGGWSRRTSLTDS